MAIKERDPAKDTERVEAFDQGFVARMNAFGERHAKLIIFISVALLIVTVLILAKVLYDRSIAERAAKDIAAADSIDKLKELKTKYKDSPILAEIIYRLANKYYEENKLLEAKAEYLEFQEKFKDHALRDMVQKALLGLNANLRFMQEEKERHLKIFTLQTHPEQRVKVEDERFRIGPPKVENPVIVFDVTGKGKFVVELFEDSAPNAVANFVKLVESKYYDGLKFEPVRDGAAVRFGRKDAGAVEYLLPAEDSGRPFEDGMLVMRKFENRPELMGAEFEILLKDAPEMKDGTVFGRVAESLPVVKQLQPIDVAASVKVDKKRKDSKYEPKTVAAPPPNPLVSFEITGKGKFVVELYEDTAPNAVANFVKLVEGKYYDGLKFEPVREGAAVRFGKKDGGAVDYLLPPENSGRPFGEGRLVMLKAANRAELLGAEFEILLKDAPDMKDGTVFGRVVEFLPVVKQLLAVDVAASVKVDRKRKDSKYEPKTVKP